MLPIDSRIKHASQQSVCTVITPKSCETDSTVQSYDWNPPFIIISRYSVLDNRKFLWCAKRHSLCWHWTSRQSPPVSSGCVALSWSKFFGQICVNIFIIITITVLIVIIMIMIFILKGTVPLKIRHVFFCFSQILLVWNSPGEFTHFLGFNSAKILTFGVKYLRVPAPQGAPAPTAWDACLVVGTGTPRVGAKVPPVMGSLNHLPPKMHLIPLLDQLSALLEQKRKLVERSF